MYTHNDTYTDTHKHIDIHAHHIWVQLGSLTHTHTYSYDSNFIFSHISSFKDYLWLPSCDVVISLLKRGEDPPIACITHTSHINHNSNTHKYISMFGLVM